LNKNIFIHFLGASGTVTGSKYLIESPGIKFLVDCGLFQGLKELRLLNWTYLPVDVSQIHFVLLTHGHLDHTGYLPSLVKAGFKGRIYATAPTLQIAEIVLKDSAKIQEEEADNANRQGYSKHKPAKPLYNLKDVEQTLSHFSEIKTNEWVDFGSELQVRYQPNGHIIGSCFIEVQISGKKFVFSGDVGQEHDLLMYPPKRPQEADILFIESTYGDRLHPDEDNQDHLKKIILETSGRGGNLVIPSFAVERTQVLMYMIWKLRESRAIPEIPCIMDSPMGANMLEVFHRNASWLKIPAEDCAKMCKVFTIIKDFRDTLKQIATPYPKIVIAGSGMVTGGRVLNYLQEYIGKPQTTILLAGYQSEGTRGRSLQDGAREIKMYGKFYEVKARIELINGLSAHADQQDLIRWLSEIKNKPERVFIIHGEHQAADVFRVKLHDVYGWDCAIPRLFDIVEIGNTLLH
jgi:metallo-beta-lactamase family protein